MINVAFFLDTLETVAALTLPGEAFPKSLVEAMAADYPAVATAGRGGPDAVVVEVSDLLVRPGDVAATTAALQRLVGNPAARIALGRKAGVQERCHFHLTR